MDVVNIVGDNDLYIESPGPRITSISAFQDDAAIVVEKGNRQMWQSEDNALREPQ
jgi:hypothetical protein